MKRQACADWPKVLCPEIGAYPLAAAPRASERVLHLAMFPGAIGQLGLSTIASAYRGVFWPGMSGSQIEECACQYAQEIKPTFVFMQIQGQGVIAPSTINAIRSLCDPSCVIVNWDGDQHFEPHEAGRAWFRELGAVCDASLVVNTDHPHVYAKMGVKHPGYFQIAADASIFHRTAPSAGIAPVVLLASCTHHVHGRRSVLVNNLNGTLPAGTFNVFGNGWDGVASGRPFVQPSQESGIYCAARAALNISARDDLGRHTSDRLFRMILSGAVCLVERFPDVEGLGLVDGVNCLLWSGIGELQTAIARCLNASDNSLEEMRAETVTLGRDHCWEARWLEMLAIIDAVRVARC
jgi:hypothetical protein